MAPNCCFLLKRKEKKKSLKNMIRHYTIEVAETAARVCISQGRFIYIRAG